MTPFFFLLHGDGNNCSYQRILHRNLMEMANYIDSMFGVYGSKRGNKSSHRTDEEHKRVEGARSLAAEALAIPNGSDTEHVATTGGAATTVVDEDKKPSALLKTLEADEKRRVIKRSNKLWMKSRHQVREEESVSAIMNETAEKIAAIAVAARDEAMESARPPSLSSGKKASKKSSKTVGASAQEKPASPRVEIKQQPDETDAVSAVSEKTPIAAAPPVPAFLPPSIPPLNGMSLMSLLTPDALARFPLPPPNAALNMFFPPVFPSLPFPTVCSGCAPLNRSAHECRNVLKHAVPPLLMDPSVAAVATAVAAMGMPWSQAGYGLGSGQSVLSARPPGTSSCLLHLNDRQRGVF